MFLEIVKKQDLFTAEPEKNIRSMDWHTEQKHKSKTNSFTEKVLN
jgi:hypothetical protein